MFKPSAEKSAKSREIINNAFTKRIGNDHNYIVAYAYYMKSGLFGQKMYSYVIGFSIPEKQIAIIPIDSDGNPADALILKKDNILSAKFGLQGDVKIKTNLDKKEIRFFVPGYTPASAESTYMLPIDQVDEAVKFKAFIKENF